MQAQYLVVILIFCAVGITELYAQGGWYVQRQFDLVLFNDVDCWNSETCYASAAAGGNEPMIWYGNVRLGGWQKIWTPGPVRLFRKYPGLFSIACRSPIRILAVGDSGFVARSSDQGVNWVEERLPTDGRLLDKLSMGDSLFGVMRVAKSPNYLLMTRDGGVSWDSVGMPIPSNFSSWGVSDIATPRPEVIYCMIGEPGHRALLRSYNGGTSWETLDHLPLDSMQAKIHFLNDSLGWFYGGFRVGKTARFRSAAIMRTTDGGETWATVFDQPVSSEGYFLALDAVRDSTGRVHVVAAASDNDFYRSSDGGLTWRRQPSERLLPQFYATAVSLPDPTYGVIVGVSGIYGYDISMSGVAQTPSWGIVENERITIEPNVVHGEEVWIRCGVQSSEGMMVRVVSADGREVLRRSIETEGTGSVSTRIATEGLTTGMYFVQVQQGDHVATGRFIVQR